MPYKLSGNAIIKSDTGEVVKRHSSRRKALAHLAALRLNVKEARAREAQQRRALLAARALEHLQGKHSQKSHGYRFGSPAAMKNTLKRLKNSDSYSKHYDIEDYRQRVRAKSADVTKDQSVKPTYGKNRVKIPAGQHSAIDGDIRDDKATYSGRKRRKISAHIVDRSGDSGTVSIEFNETGKGTNTYTLEIGGKKYSGIGNKDAGIIGKELINRRVKNGKITSKDVKEVINATVNKDFVGQKNSKMLTVDVTRDGKKEKLSVPALSYNGLSIHKSTSEPGKITITHDKSGLKIGDVNSLAQAKSIAGKLTKAGNWNAPSDKIDPVARAAMRQLREDGELE